MTQKTMMTEPHRKSVWRVAGYYAAALMLGATTWWAVHRLSTDDCTTVITTLPDGAQIETNTCS